MATLAGIPASPGRASREANGHVYAQEALGSLASPFGRGDRVQVWSASQRAWTEGRVDKVLTENYTKEDGTIVPTGSVRVATARANFYIPPQKIADVLRKVVDEAALIAVIGPGAGVKANGAVYQEVKEDARFRVQVLGGRGENYDRYPEYWDGGSAPPNLESFGAVLVSEGIAARADCIVAGSRGGQVVLPVLWRAFGTSTPPAVCINGGCSMSLPGPAIQWPPNAVTIMVLGGDDYFRAATPAKEYVINARKRVPQGNTSTAVLFVMEMEHMPQSSLMQIMLRPLMLAAIFWKSSGNPPLDILVDLCGDLQSAGWNGQLSYLNAKGEWLEKNFGDAALAQPDSPQDVKAAKASRNMNESLQAYKKEEERVLDLGKQVEDTEKKLHELRVELAAAKERSRRLKEAAGLATAPPATDESRAAAGKYRKGQKAQYWSISQKGWVDCEVTATRASDGACQISVKPDTWLLTEQQATHLRSKEASMMLAAGAGAGTAAAARPAAPAAAKPPTMSAPAAAFSVAAGVAQLGAGQPLVLGQTPMTRSTSPQSYVSAAAAGSAGPPSMTRAAVAGNGGSMQVPAFSPPAQLTSSSAAPVPSRISSVMPASQGSQLPAYNYKAASVAVTTVTSSGSAAVSMVQASPGRVPMSSMQSSSVQMAVGQASAQAMHRSSLQLPPGGNRMLAGSTQPSSLTVTAVAADEGELCIAAAAAAGLAFVLDGDCRCADEGELCIAAAAAAGLGGRSERSIRSLQ
eukprot:CAMPEP_0203856278 /NCGR_PEP_ID=MMETSP0359-20131031/10086_1 /ASSEMBLY_ACC=CAM_ASM_000338 /TAXON_ID=268821 /ORGANISM="Scrippsiella Hangoei, Strain SHTV-5" /LENGTH=747 /DNA_ID=CAMNT_0050772871 /DNA_START=22 /DNA_END=2261 /DNA_ORIENTATION=+